MAQNLLPIKGSNEFQMAEGANPLATIREAYAMLGQHGRTNVTFRYGRNQHGPGYVSVERDTNVEAMAACLAESIRTGVLYHMSPSTVSIS